MEIVTPSYVIVEPDISLNQERILRLLEVFGKVCYQSKAGETPESGARFVRSIIDKGHESVVEHLSVTVIVQVDRGVSHEWVRHRIAAYSQESTRYCNYGKQGVRFIMPPWMANASIEERAEFALDLVNQEQLYLKWLHKWRNPETGKESPEKARYWLPQGVKTQLVATHNFREWRYIFRLRDAPKAHPQMREIMAWIHADFAARAPIIFGEEKQP